MSSGLTATITSVTANKPVDIYTCLSGGTGCEYIATVASFPFSFEVPASVIVGSVYLIKLIDQAGCEITQEMPTP
jgi:hypothetical protein